MHITDNALKQLNYELSLRNTPESGIRLFTTSSCCFPDLLIDVVDKAGDGDKMMIFNDLVFYVTLEAKQIISKLIIDFTEGKYKFGLGRKVPNMTE